MIKVAKLVTGEYVIGSMLELNLTNVMLIRFNVDQKAGIMTKNLLPYMSPLSDSLGKLITSDKIVAFDDAPQDIQLQYLQQMQSVIKDIKGDMRSGKPNPEKTTTAGSNAVHGENSETPGEDKGTPDISK